MCASKGHVRSDSRRRDDALHNFQWFVTESVVIFTFDGDVGGCGVASDVASGACRLRNRSPASEGVHRQSSDQTCSARLSCLARRGRVSSVFLTEPVSLTKRYTLFVYWTSSGSKAILLAKEEQRMTFRSLLPNFLQKNTHFQEKF